MSTINIKGEVVTLYLKAGRKKYRYPALRNPELVDMGGKIFIAGIATMKNENHWAFGKRWLFAVDDIESLIEHDSEEQFHQMYVRVKKGGRPGFFQSKKLIIGLLILVSVILMMAM